MKVRRKRNTTEPLVSRRKAASKTRAVRTPKGAVNFREPSDQYPQRWKKGKSGNPAGRPKEKGSIRGWLKAALRGPPLARTECEEFAEELMQICAERAVDGDYRFMSMIIELTESRTLTQEEATVIVERLFNVVTKHVQIPEILEAIAQDLGLMGEKE